MVYIKSWQAYQDAAESLYARSPDKTRYCIKWKSSEGKLVLKITDNVECIKFKTHSSIFLNRFEALNLSLMQRMQGVQPPPPSSSSVQLPAQQALKEEEVAAQIGGTPQPQQSGSKDVPGPGGGARTPTTVPPHAGVAGGGVKKKKGKKKGGKG